MGKCKNSVGVGLTPFFFMVIKMKYATYKNQKKIFDEAENGGFILG